MKKWLCRLFGIGDEATHLHHWKIIENSNVFQEGSTSKLPIGNKYTLQCEECGDITYRKTY
jgi:hypothetical protein